MTGPGRDQLSRPLDHSAGALIDDPAERWAAALEVSPSSEMRRTTKGTNSMKRIVEIVGQPLEWTQPSALKMQYELRSDDAIVATLGFRSSFGSFATGQSADGCWTFKRVGFWQTRVTIRECNGEKEVGQFRNNVWKGGGGLELPDGRRFLATTNIWETKLEFQDGSGAPLLQLKSRGVIHAAAAVEILPRVVEIPELPLMVLLAWYVVVMMHQDSAGATAAAVAAG